MELAPGERRRVVGVKLFWISGRKDERQVLLKLVNDLEPERLHQEVELAQNPGLQLRQLNLGPMQGDRMSL
jgi:hypothetical protein